MELVELKFGGLEAEYTLAKPIRMLCGILEGRQGGLDTAEVYSSLPHVGEHKRGLPLECSPTVGRLVDITDKVESNWDKNGTYYDFYQVFWLHSNGKEVGSSIIAVPYEGSIRFTIQKSFTVYGHPYEEGEYTEDIANSIPKIGDKEDGGRYKVIDIEDVTDCITTERQDAKYSFYVVVFGDLQDECLGTHNIIFAKREK